MLKRILLLHQLAFLLFAAGFDSQIAAQARKPSQTLRQVAEHQRKMSETFSREAEADKDQPPDLADLEELDEAVKKFAAERAAGFKISDWKGDELYSLALLYQISEQFAPAAEAFRAYLSSDARTRSAPNARIGLARALIEMERIEEAEKLLENMELGFIEGPVIRAARAGLLKDLAVALRDRGFSEKSAELARKGYSLADDSIALLRGAAPELRETTERNRIVLAALAVAAYERAGRKKEAGDLNDLVLKFDFDDRPELRAVYESELASARLVGMPAPELVIARWLDGQPKNLSDLRGKVVLLDFWAMWCGPCVAAFPRLRDFQSKYADKGLEVVGVTRFYGRSDAEESLSREQEWKSLQSYKAKHKLAYPFAVGKMDDVTNEERYGVVGLPAVILIDRRGNVRHVKRGVGEYRKLEKQIEKLIGEK
jgi:thiol-disulfide isomerase/thioredoxin